MDNLGATLFQQTLRFMHYRRKRQRWSPGQSALLWARRIHCQHQRATSVDSLGKKGVRDNFGAAIGVVKLSLTPFSDTILAWNRHARDIRGPRLDGMLPAWSRRWCQQEA